MEKCIAHRLKLLDIVQKMLAPLRKVFAPPSDPSWLRACPRFEYGGAKLVFCPGRHLTSLWPCSRATNCWNKHKGWALHRGF